MFRFVEVKVTLFVFEYLEGFVSPLGKTFIVLVRNQNCAQSEPTRLTAATCSFEFPEPLVPGLINVCIKFTNAHLLSLTEGTGIFPERGGGMLSLPLVASHPADATVHDALGLTHELLHRRFLSLDANMQLRESAEFHLIGKSQPCRVKAEQRCCGSAIVADASELLCSRFGCTRSVVFIHRRQRAASSAGPRAARAGNPSRVGATSRSGHLGPISDIGSPCRPLTILPGP